jgi:hypothetical protein
MVQTPVAPPRLKSKVAPVLPEYPAKSVVPVCPATTPSAPVIESSATTTLVPAAGEPAVVLFNMTRGVAVPAPLWDAEIIALKEKYLLAGIDIKPVVVVVACAERKSVVATIADGL